MLTQFVDWAELKLAPQTRIVSFVAIWFWLGVAVQARFIQLPDLPLVAERALFWSGVIANALWWAWLRPAIEQRRLEREENLPSQE